MINGFERFTVGVNDLPLCNQLVMFDQKNAFGHSNSKVYLEILMILNRLKGI